VLKANVFITSTERPES